MSSVINATTSSGIAVSGDNSGQLEIQTNSGTTAITVTTGQGVKVKNTIGVGDATPSTSGAGITFPATQSASTDANTLDDYEEGTFTPDIKNQSSSSTFTVKNGYYTKIGNQVTCWGQCDGGNSGTAGSAIIITGLPFTSSSTNNNVCVGTATYNSGTSSFFSWQGLASSTQANSYVNSSNFTAQITYIGFLITYRVA